MFGPHQEPIVAIATAPGRGAVGIVRVSGKNLSPFIDSLLGSLPPPRRARYAPFHAEDGSTIDQGLAIYFPAPHSYTGEDVLELQAHGGPVVLQLLLARCLEVAQLPPAEEGPPCLPGLRLAQPGEFTQRAFLNDKIDLAQAEAIADLIDAHTEAAARCAARSLSGAFSVAVNGLLKALVHLRMLVEATLDFPEEEIDFIEKTNAAGLLDRLRAQLADIAQRAVQGAVLREGIKVVIAGQPNVGKSSLLNALAGAEVAIVTPVAGTTRDKVTQLIQIEGVPVHIVDTAGLRATQDEVEKIGIERAWAEIHSADAVLFLHDLTRYPASDASHDAIEYIAEDARILSAMGIKYHQNGGAMAAPSTFVVPVIDVWNKADAVPLSALAEPRQGVTISALTGDGLETLRRQLLHSVGWRNAADGAFMARQRHVEALAKVSTALNAAAAQLAAVSPALDLLAEDLRQAQLHLGQITGQFTPEDLLGEIFSNFCIGK